MKRLSEKLVTGYHSGMSLTRTSLVARPAPSIVDPASLPPEDLTVHVRIRRGQGPWHKRAIGYVGRKGACGCDIPVPPDGDPELRHESYLGVLCTDGCFSPWELEQSAKANAADHQRTLDFDVKAPPGSVLDFDPSRKR